MKYVNFLTPYYVCWGEASLTMQYIHVHVHVHVHVHWFLYIRMCRIDSTCAYIVVVYSERLLIFTLLYCEYGLFVAQSQKWNGRLVFVCSILFEEKTQSLC